MGTIEQLKRKRVREGGKLTGKRINKNCQLQYSWCWPAKVEALIKPFVVGYSINVPAGLSDLGIVKGDIEPMGRNVIKMDMDKLPYPDDTFDTCIGDPPWKIPFFKRQRPFFELVRVCKVGGRIIYNSTWRPTSKYIELERVYLRTDNNWANISAIWFFKKIKDITL
jgi:hypothetical protein